MTHAWKERDLQYVEPPSIWLWGKYVAPVILDLVDTLAQFHAQTVVPALKAFGYMIFMLIRTFFFSWLEDLGRETVQYHQRLQDAAVAAKKSESKSARRSKGLSVESAVSLRKIQGAIGESWSTNASTPIRVYQGKENPWLDSRRIHSNKAVLSSQQGVSSKSKPNTSKRAASSAPAAEEEIRGLDDIFDRPVTGFFLDSDKSVPARPVQKKTGATHQSKLPDYQLADTQAEAPEQSMPLEGAQFDSAKREVCSCKQTPAKVPVQAAQASVNWVRTQASAPIRIEAAEPVCNFENETDWASMTEAEAYHFESMFEAEAHYEELAGIQSDFEEPQEETITGGTSSVVPFTFNVLEQPTALVPVEEPVLPPAPVEAQLPPQPVASVERLDSVSKLDSAPVETPVTPVEAPIKKSMMDMALPKSIAKAMPWFAQESAAPATEPAAKKMNSLEQAFSAIPWFLQDKASAVPAASVQSKSEQTPEPKPESPKAVVAPQNPATPPAHKPLTLEHELEEDLSSFNYMAQSNRILSNSITNLVDSYFRKAAEEEEPDFY